MNTMDCARDVCVMEKESNRKEKKKGQWGNPDSRNGEEDIGWIARDLCVTGQRCGYTIDDSVTDFQCDIYVAMNEVSCSMLHICYYVKW